MKSITSCAFIINNWQINFESAIPIPLLSLHTTTPTILQYDAYLIPQYDAYLIPHYQANLP